MFLSCVVKITSGIVVCSEIKYWQYRFKGCGRVYDITLADTLGNIAYTEQFYSLCGLIFVALGLTMTRDHK